MPHTPCCLQIETACNGIDIKHFAGKEEVRTDTAFERIHIDGSQRHAATGDKLVAEAAFAVYLIYVVGERFHKAVGVFLAQFAPPFLLRQTQFRQYIKPEACRKIERAHRSELLLAFAAAMAATASAATELCVMPVQFTATFVR